MCVCVCEDVLLAQGQHSNQSTGSLWSSSFNSGSGLGSQRYRAHMKTQKCPFSFLFFPFPSPSISLPPQNFLYLNVCVEISKKPTTVWISKTKKSNPGLYCSLCSRGGLLTSTPCSCDDKLACPGSPVWAHLTGLSSKNR